MLFFLLQTDLSKWRPENLFGQQVLERTPAGLSLVYLGGIALVALILITASIINRRHKFNFEQDLPKEVKKKLGTTSSNRSLQIWRVVFTLLAFTVFGFHVYWTYYADETNEEFKEVSYKDLRGRRTSASTLRGWMLDRSGKLSDAFAYYKHEQDGDIVRTYSLDREMSQLLGTERGTPGLERTLFKKVADPMPEAWEVFTKVKKPEEEQKDVKVTIDRDLQLFLAQQLQGKKGAVVVLNPQTGEVLATYSNPSFAMSEARDLDDYLRLEGNKKDKPLLNRATREYYVPGSTFKTFTMLGAFHFGKANQMFTSSPEGFIPFRGSRGITDANGGCEPPYGCTTLNIAQAFEASSNQYFAQMAVDLGRDRIREMAGLVGISPVETPEDALQSKIFPDLWNTSDKRIANSIATQQSTIVTGKEISNYDIGLEGMGQGYAGQMTPFQMALIASIPGNMEGKLMRPKIEVDQAPQMFSQVISPQQASNIRDIMALVTEGGGGTAKNVRAMMGGTGIRVGGKTGTAEKLAPLYDEKTGRLKTVKKKRKNANGDWEEYNSPQMYERTDSWFIAIAPLERPQVAIAVVVEGGGFGAKTAAPIAASVILKARDLGLLGDQYKPKVVQTTPKKKGK
jgi:ribosomal protein S9